uniref:H(+)-exporting diphosphatase n=1 Tax=Calcidiscus leptoporus TaxID=127549 RepID=A0A7S0IZC6_9EUKA|mmetsp:Transcript_31289/g.72801  ORF Transcript_31289/g.72801 Transcript_31289/m.72801 type:complete len:136 (+) Transcript_31289:49-456(+)
MLRADKEHLERDLKRSLLLLAEKELNFFEQCLNSVGTQAALIAGFASAIIVETASDLLLEASLGIQVAWIFATVLGMVLQILCVVSAMQLSILAAGLALRGPDGSMSYALAETRKEYRNVIRLFYSGAHFHGAWV